MFDKLIVSEPEGADFKNRRNYFLVSSLVVGVLFLTAVVFSIFASDYGLGHNSFELVEMVAPPDMATTEPEPQRPQAPTQSHSTSQLPTRRESIQNVIESPIVPQNISVVPNTSQSRPLTPYLVSSTDTNPESSGRPDNTGPGTGFGDPNPQGPQVSADPVETAPPAIKKDPPVVTKPPTQTLGVINGKATSLSKPIYTPAAKAIRAQGAVNVQVTIDEQGNVTSANAVSGHPLLRATSEQAARSAKFSVTYLSHVPVKVTGVIVYNFIRN